MWFESYFRTTVLFYTVRSSSMKQQTSEITLKLKTDPLYWAMDGQVLKNNFWLKFNVVKALAYPIVQIQKCIPALLKMYTLVSDLMDQIHTPVAPACLLLLHCASSKFGVKDELCFFACIAWV